MKPLLIASLIFSLFSCAPKKTFVKTTEIKIDTVYIKEKVRVVPATRQRLVISNLCDTITREVVVFKKSVYVGSDSLEVLTNLNNELIVQNSNQADTLSFLKDQYEASVNKEQLIHTKIVYRIAWRYCFAAFIIGLLLGGYGYRKLF